MQDEKWFEKYTIESYTAQFSKRVVEVDDIPALLQEHTERIIKEIEGFRGSHVPSDCASQHSASCIGGYELALDAVINHLKK